jgi:uncharacterized lipoprotein YbaY
MSVMLHMRHMISLAAVLLMTACAREASERPAAPLPIAAPVQAARVPLKDYPPEKQTRVADELQALPEGSVLAQFIQDYGQLRRAVCAAEGWKQPTCRRIQAADKEKSDAAR